MDNVTGQTPLEGINQFIYRKEKKDVLEVETHNTVYRYVRDSEELPTGYYRYKLVERLDNVG